MEENKKIINKKQRIYLIVGVVLFLILVLSASYAYFAITSVNNATSTTVTGTGEELGSPTLTTKTTSLGLNLTSELMSSSNIFNYIFATPDGNEIITPILFKSQTSIAPGNGQYELATASVSEGAISYNCDYNFDISATVTNPITDRSDEDVYVTITTPKSEIIRFNLAQLLEETKTVSGTISNLTVGTPQTFLIDSFVYNHGMYNQEGLVGNEYSIKVTPKSGTQGFSCTAVTEPVVTGFAKTLIDSNKMIQTGFEGDGYRVVGNGPGDYCSYDNNNYIIPTYDEPCNTLYNYTRTNISTGAIYNAKYQTRCLSDNESYTYSCTTLTPTVVSNMDPDNYVCFGTTSKEDCTANPDKYMYRVVGVFPDDYGNQHVKLIKLSSIGNYAWHSTLTPILEWGKSDLYKGLNGSYFLTNTNYEYMQNSTWKNKITDWRWVSVNRGMTNRGNSNDMITYFVSYTTSTKLENIYIVDMNRSNKTSLGGMWSYVNAKIGLINISDFKLAHPSALNIGNKSEIEENWINTFTNDDFGWTLSAFSNPTIYLAIETTSYYGSYDATETVGAHVNPAFYLNSNVEVSSGTGTETDPYMIKQ